MSRAYYIFIFMHATPLLRIYIEYAKHITWRVYVILLWIGASVLGISNIYSVGICLFYDRSHQQYNRKKTYNTKTKYFFQKKRGMKEKKKLQIPTWNMNESILINAFRV